MWTRKQACACLGEEPACEVEVRPSQVTLTWHQVAGMRQDGACSACAAAVNVRPNLPAREPR